MFSFSDIFLKISINKYLKKLNKKLLRDTYLILSRRNPKTHVDNIYLQCLIKEFKRRGLAI